MYNQGPEIIKKMNELVKLIEKSKWATSDARYTVEEAKELIEEALKKMWNAQYSEDR